MMADMSIHRSAWDASELGDEMLIDNSFRHVDSIRYAIAEL